jgi:hypothetical protein
MIPVFVFLARCASRVGKEKKYEIKAQGLGEILTKQASACVSQSKAYAAVWEYAKVTGIDFKTAAAEMLTDETRYNLSMMKENKTKIENLLSELENPPPQYAKSFKILEEIYDIYQKLHTLALNPMDDMEKHNASVNKLSLALMEKKKELDAIFLY